MHIHTYIQVQIKYASRLFDLLHLSAFVASPAPHCFSQLNSLFNLYAEYIMRNAGLHEAQAGIKIAKRNIDNLRYADDHPYGIK